MYDYRRGGHAKYSLKAHIIFVTKYRRRIFDREPEDQSVKELMHLAAESYDFDIIRMETDGDHIHMLIDFRPDMTISDIMKYMKQYSTYYMWKRHESVLRLYYWKRRILWSDGYFACSIGQVSQEIIERYIENQG